MSTPSPTLRDQAADAPHPRDHRPSFKKESISENKDVNVWIEKYLNVGEWVLDQSVAVAGASSFFERKR